MNCFHVRQHNKSRSSHPCHGETASRESIIKISVHDSPKLRLQAYVSLRLLYTWLFPSREIFSCCDFLMLRSWCIHFCHVIDYKNILFPCYFMSFIILHMSMLVNLWNKGLYQTCESYTTQWMLVVHIKTGNTIIYNVSVPPPIHKL